MTDSFLTQEELADAAFLLLTSSSLNRYARMAKRVGSHSRLMGRLRADPDMVLRLVRHAAELWRAMLKGERRDIPEAELAVILPILTQTALPEVDDLLTTIGLVDRPTVSWVSALARQLFQERSTNDLRSSNLHKHLALPKVVLSQSSTSADFKSITSYQPRFVGVVCPEGGRLTGL